MVGSAAGVLACARVAESAIYAWEVGGRAQLRTPPRPPPSASWPPKSCSRRGGLIRWRPLSRGGVGAQARDRLADDARDLHLLHADALADLGLREVLGEAQVQDLALARRDGAHEVLDRGAVLGQGEAVLLGSQRVAQRVAALLLAAARRLE